MQQAWHIFKKDVLHLRREIVLYLVMVVVFCGFVGYTFPSGSLWATFEGPVMIIATALLIARSIHGEALVGDRQFWITRPYRWSSLLGAKLLFLVVLVHLPVLLIQWLVVSRHHFPFPVIWPGLLVGQLLLLGTTLFLAAVAALTEGLISFAIAALCLMAFRMAFWQNSLGSMEWIRFSFVVVVMLLVSAFVLYVQYRARRTLLSGSVAAGMLAAGSIIYVFMPWTIAFAIQERFSKQRFDPGTVAITLEPGAGNWALAAGKEKRVPLILPLRMHGFPAGTGVHPEGLEITLHAESGRGARASTILARDPELETATRPVLVSNAEIDRSFFEAERDHPVLLRGTLYFTIFGNDRVVQLQPRVDTAVTERLRCSFAIGGVICDAPFRWPSERITVVPGTGTKRSLSYFPSYAPLPGGLSYYPIDRRWVPGMFAAPESLPVFVEVTEPLAYVRQEFEIRDVRLVDIAVPWRTQWVSRNGKSVLESEY